MVQPSIAENEYHAVRDRRRKRMNKKCFQVLFVFSMVFKEFQGLYFGHGQK